MKSFLHILYLFPCSSCLLVTFYCITCGFRFTFRCKLRVTLVFVKAILQLAESGSFFGQVDLFKVRAKFALTDAYEDHFMLPKGRIILVTHRRVILLQVSE